MTRKRSAPTKARSPAGASRGPRRSREELRSLLIEAGIDFLDTHGLGTGAEHLTFKRALDHLEATRQVKISAASVIGRVWDNQAAYQTEVLAAIAEDEGATEIDATMKTVARIVERAEVSTLEDRWKLVRDLCRLGGAANLNAIVSSERWRLWLGIWSLATTGLPSERNAHIEEALERSYARITVRYESLYTSLLDVAGFRVRSPLTIRQLTVAIAALAEGCALRDRIDQRSVRRIRLPSGEDGRSQEWTLFGIGIEALVRHYVEPIPRWTPTIR